MTYKCWTCLLVLCLLLAGCSADPGTNNAPSDPAPAPAPAPEPEPEQPPEAETPPEDPAAALLADLTLEEKLGQLVILGLEGTSMEPETQEMIERYHVGGFILYQDNIDSLAQTAQLVNELKEANRQNSVPLLLGVDQEGGRVDRMPSGISAVPSPRRVAEADDKRFSYATGQALGIQVRALGLNLNFAPVLDVNNNARNPVIGDRSYGDLPDAVIRHGLEAMDGLRSTRVIPVVKHFPGHGDTDVDSHLDLPVIHKTKDELENFELKPFAAAIAAETDAVMVAHLLIPGLDPDRPASLSEAIITDLLRGEMGFEGVVMTDDLTMQGITKHHTVGEAAVLTLLAGSDIVLIGHHHGQQAEVLDAIRQSVEDGLLTEQQLDEKTSRVLRLKQSYQLNDDPVEPADADALNGQVQSVLEEAR
ncbi:beta-N-acetylhexosaminidase [Paenibacillus sp. 1P07SE]|uniref:beta-N-acetylhexosaminidase n=1 Tax=Paenibacillus sp. 1P07SE TaxID=3132209 RepID=UPI0039A4E74F